MISLLSSLLKGYHQPDFYRSGRQEDIDQFLSSQQYISRQLGCLRLQATKKNFDLTSSLDSLRLISLQTIELGKQLKLLYFKRGFENEGLEGRMRTYAHYLEDSTRIAKIELLQLRRHEKDYVQQGDLKFAQLFFRQMRQTISSLAANDPVGKFTSASHCSNDCKCHESGQGDVLSRRHGRISFQTAAH